jgi:A/G-specific adenine glycosylase
MMDLGATICTPRRPACGLCPVRTDCRGYVEGIAERLPYRDEKGARPLRRGAAFVAIRPDGAVLLRERPLRGLLGGMLETPSTPWAEGKTVGKSWRAHAPLEADWRKMPGLVEHTFTHFHLELEIYRAEVGRDAQPRRSAQPERCRWLKLRQLQGAALPSVMRKVLLHALDETRVSSGARASPAPPRAKRRSA